jgi:nucleoside-diphosphate-sugar epimerase
MRLLVTGARGFVGRGLLPWLAGQGFSGIATGSEPPRDLPEGWQGAARGDVLGGRQDVGSVDAVVHLEVRQHVPRPTAADEAEFARINVGGTRDWLDWATARGLRRFVFVSTIKAVASGDGPRLESAPLTPNTPYGRSKAAAEGLVREWAAASPAREAVILRPAPVYGPGNEANLAAFVRQVLTGKPCLIGGGDTQKSIVSRTNLAAAIAFAAKTARPGCEVFNVSDRETLSLRELANLVATLAHAPPPRSIPGPLAALVAPVGNAFEVLTGREFPLTTSRLRSIRETSIFPCDKLVAAGYVHPQSTREGLAEMLAWLTSRP